VLSRPGNSGELTGYYQWRKCKWLFFDCKCPSDLDCVWFSLSNILF
jgi:hypothetical protein